MGKSELHALQRNGAHKLSNSTCQYLCTWQLVRVDAQRGVVQLSQFDSSLRATVQTSSLPHLVLNGMLLRGGMPKPLLCAEYCTLKFEGEYAVFSMESVSVRVDPSRQWESPSYLYHKELVHANL